MDIVQSEVQDSVACALCGRQCGGPEANSRCSVCASCASPDCDASRLVLTDSNANDCELSEASTQPLDELSKLHLRDEAQCETPCANAQCNIAATDAHQNSDHARFGDRERSLEIAIDGLTDVITERAESANDYESDSEAESGDDDENGNFVLPVLGDFITRVSSAEMFDDPPSRPKFIGPYLVSGRLGSGSYATVKECIDARSLRRHAVKILSYRKGRKIPTFEQDIRTEIRLLKRLQHPNVIELFDVLEKRKSDNLKQYLILTYCIADLQRILEHARGHKFPEYQAQRYFRQTCDGLEYLHSVGVVHKDIKPGNLLVAPNDTVRITDFSVAEQLCQFAADDQIRRSAGTIAFQPPEVFNSSENETYPGFKLDIWSLGVTLYNISSGTLPFRVNSDPGGMFRLMAIIGQAEWTLPEGLSESLGQLITRMMDRNASTRCSLAQVKQSEWYIAKLERSEIYVNANIGSREAAISQSEMFEEPDGTCTVRRNALDTVCRMDTLKHVEWLDSLGFTRHYDALPLRQFSSTSAGVESLSATTSSNLPVNSDEANNSAMDMTGMRRTLTDEDIEKEMRVSELKTNQLYARMHFKDDELDEDSEALCFTIRPVPPSEEEIASTQSPSDANDELANPSGFVGSQLQFQQLNDATVLDKLPQVQDKMLKKSKQKKSLRVLQFCKVS